MGGKNNANASKNKRGKTLSEKISEMVAPKRTDVDPEDLSSFDNAFLKKKKSDVYFSDEENKSTNKAGLATKLTIKQSVVDPTLHAGKYQGKAVSRDKLNAEDTKGNFTDDFFYDDDVSTSSQDDESEEGYESSNSSDSEKAQKSTKNKKSKKHTISLQDPVDTESSSDSEADRAKDEEAADMIEEFTKKFKDNLADEMLLVGESESESESDDEDEENDDLKKQMKELKKEEREAVKHLTEQTNKDLEKAKHVHNQKILFDTMLNYRIKMQKLLNSANRLPQPDMHDEFCKHNDKIKAEFQNCANEVSGLLQDLTRFQKELITQNNEMKMKTFFSAKHPKNNHPINNYNFDSQDIQWDQIKNLFESYSGYRDEILERWGRKTNLFSQNKNFKALNQSISTQVKNTLLDMDQLVKKTQLKRSKYNVLGKRKRDEDMGESEQRDSHLEDYDPEIFDDTDFYEILLKDLIQDIGQDGVADSSSLTHIYLTMKNLNKKSTKKAVDKRASKGRKLKYSVHDKLVNFMTPHSHAAPEMANALFKSLFGGNRNDNDNDNDEDDAQEIANPSVDTTEPMEVASE